MNIALLDVLLLAWAGLAASLCFAWIRPPAASGTRLTRFPAAIALALLVYSPVYGLLFETIHRADVLTGVLAGTVHGGAALLVRWRRPGSPRAPTVVSARVILAHIAFGAVLAALYVVRAA